jgi:hypothetical protein
VQNELNRYAVAKYVMSSFEIEIYINKTAANNQQQKQAITLPVVQKISYLLGGDWTASDKTPKQSMRKGF